MVDFERNFEQFSLLLSIPLDITCKCQKTLDLTINSLDITRTRLNYGFLLDLQFDIFPSNFDILFFGQLNIPILHLKPQLKIHGKLKEST